LREAAGLSQADLRRLSGLSQTTISLLESGVRNPSAETLRKLIDGLGCSPDRLLLGKPTGTEARIDREIELAKLDLDAERLGAARDRLEWLLTDERPVGAGVRDELRLVLADVYERTGDRPAAIAIHLALWDRATSAHPHIPIVATALALCTRYVDAGDYPAAIQIGQGALTAIHSRSQRTRQRTNDSYRLIATVLRAHIELGDYDHARAWVNRLLSPQVHRSPDLREGETAIRWSAALLTAREGRLTQALPAIERTIGAMGEPTTSHDAARASLDYAALLMLDTPPQLDRADQILNRAQPGLRTLGSPTDVAISATLKSKILLLRGHLTAAETAAPALQAAGLLALASALAVQGKHETAADARARAFVALRQAPTTPTMAIAWRELATAEHVAGNPPAVWEAATRALDCAGVTDLGRNRAAGEHDEP
jgi:transcriptional regulator with XRE-family HTH domain